LFSEPLLRGSATNGSQNPGTAPFSAFTSTIYSFAALKVTPVTFDVMAGVLIVDSRGQQKKFYGYNF
jgi:hypothetical protein